jgi:hypothetical protein
MVTMIGITQKDMIPIRFHNLSVVGESEGKDIDKRSGNTASESALAPSAPALQ